MGKHTEEQKWTADEDRLILLFANPNGRHKGFQDVRTLGAAAEEQQLTRRLEGEGFDGWMDEDWKMEVEEGLRAGVDVREGVDGSPQECHIASMRKFANELLDQGFLEPDSPRRTRRGSVFA